MSCGRTIQVRGESNVFQQPSRILSFCCYVGRGGNGGVAKVSKVNDDGTMNVRYVMGGSEKNVLPTHVSIDGEMKKRVVVKTKADAPAQSENVRPKTVVKAMETECALKVCCEMYSRCTIKMTNSWLNCRLMLSKAALTPP